MKLIVATILLIWMSVLQLSCQVHTQESHILIFSACLIESGNDNGSSLFIEKDDHYMKNTGLKFFMSNFLLNIMNQLPEVRR